MHWTMGKDHDIQTVPSSTTTLTLLIFVLKITQRHLFGSISRVSMLWKINEFEKWAPHKLTVYAQQNLNRHPKGRNELNEFFIRIILSSKCIFLDQWVCYGSMFWTFFVSCENITNHSVMKTWMMIESLFIMIPLCWSFI